MRALCASQNREKYVLETDDRENGLSIDEANPQPYSAPIDRKMTLPCKSMNGSTTHSADIARQAQEHAQQHFLEQLGQRRFIDTRIRSN